MRRAGAVLAALVAALALAEPAAADSGASSPERVDYRPPVDAPLLDLFRPPESRFGAGNRGVDYATEPGGDALASAAGEVVFAGRAGPGLHVVVLHPDGLRTSYSFLATVDVRRGEQVRAGQKVGTTGAAMHFGARAGDTYLDPLTLLAGERPTVHLVPEHDRLPRTESEERSGLEGLLRGAFRGIAGAAGAAIDFGADAFAWARDASVDVVEGAVDEVLGWAHYFSGPLGLPWRIGEAAWDWLGERQNCTAPDVAPPAPHQRRIAVLVGGLGSATGRASVLDVDTAALGYAPGDVEQFSYRAGEPYAPQDTQGDIAAAGALLAAELRRLRAENPGVPIDVIAHSQGGLVARSALVSRDAPDVATVVTLGSPHRGADLATAVAMISHTVVGHAVLSGAHDALDADIDPHSTSVLQMSETSSFIRDLNSRPLPDGTRFVSVGARGDLVVSASRTEVEGADNIVVSVPEGGVLEDHGALPGSAAAEREIALAIAAMPPTCESFFDHMTDVIAGEGVSLATDGMGAVLTIGGHRLTPVRLEQKPQQSPR